MDDATTIIHKSAIKRKFVKEEIEKTKKWKEK